MPTVSQMFICFKSGRGKKYLYLGDLMTLKSPFRFRSFIEFQLHHLQENRSLFLYKKVLEYTVFQNGRHFSILLFSCKLALVASFLNSKFKRIFPLNEATRANLLVNKRILKLRPFWNKVYYINYCYFRKYRDRWQAIHDPSGMYFALLTFS